MNLVVVIVTFNRLGKLKKSLACFDTQTVACTHLVVVNNHSNDGTAEWLYEWLNATSAFSKHVLTMSENLGGSGGFYEGQKYAMTLNPDWVYLADDDAYAESDLIEKFMTFVDNHDCSKFSAICASVLNMDETYSLYHRCRLTIHGHNYYDRSIVLDDEYKKEFFSVDLLSYVGAIINAGALKKVGLVNPDYFIFYDDTEHSLRLNKFGEIICVPLLRVVHEGGASSYKDSRPIVTWRQYYEYRNRWHVLRKHYFWLGINNFWIYFRHLWFYNIETAPLRKVMKDAWIDSFFGRLGKHTKYVPGWKVDG